MVKVESITMASIVLSVCIIMDLHVLMRAPRKSQPLCLSRVRCFYHSPTENISPRIDTVENMRDFRNSRAARVLNRNHQTRWAE